MKFVKSKNEIPVNAIAVIAEESNWINMLGKPAKSMKYHIIENINEIDSFIKNESNKIYHEHLRENQPQKIYFDIDINSSLQKELADAGHDFDEILFLLKSQIIEVFNNDFASIKPMDKTQITEDSITIFEMNRADKMSYHIIIQGFATNSIGVKKFANVVAYGLEYCYGIPRKIFDLGIYKNSNNLRLAGSAKYKARDSYKDPKNLTVKECLVGIYENEFELNFVPADPREKEKPEVEVNDDVHAAILSVETPGFDFSEIKGNLVLYRRNGQTCFMCNRPHSSDNAFATISETNSAVFLNFMCHRYHAENEEPKPKNFLLIRKENSKQEKKDKTKQMAEYVNSTQPDEYKKNCDFDLSLFNDPCSLICAPMGIGKTNLLIEYLKKLSDQCEDFSILLVSFRVTFTDSFLNRLNRALEDSGIKFEDYRSNPSKKSRFVICQAESLKKLKRESFDVVICDEYSSIEKQFFSPTMKKSGVTINFDAFEHYLRSAAKTIIMDAYLNENHKKNIEKILEKPLEIKYYQKQTSKRRVFYTGKEKDFKARLVCDLKAGRKVVMVTNMGDKLANGYCELAKSMGLSAVYYSSKTDKNKKNADMSDVNEAWKNMDLVIFTPTILAGISFDLVHFEAIYIYASDRSCDVDSLIQMTGRVRQAEDYILYYRGSFSKQEIKRESVYNYHCGKFNYYRELIGELPEFMYRRNCGKTNTIEDFSPLVQIWLNYRYNQIYENYNYGRLLLKRFINMGWKMIPIELDPEESEQLEEDQVSEKLKEYAVNLDNIHFDKLASSTWKAEDSQLIDDILKKNPEDLNESEYYIIARYKIGAAYGIQNIGQIDVSAEWFGKFANYEMIQKFRNRRSIEIHGGKPSEESTKAEIEKYLNSGEFFTKKTTNKQKIIYCYEVLNLLGFNGLDFSTEITKQHYTENIVLAANHKNDFKRHEMGIRIKTEPKTPQGALKHLNPILKSILGISIESNKKRTNYFLVDNLSEDLETNLIGPKIKLNPEK